MVSCGVVGWSDLVVWIGGGDGIWWSDLVVGSWRWSFVVFGCGRLIWLSMLWWSDEQFHGLIWSCAWRRWSGLTVENWKIRSWVNSSKTWLNSVSDIYVQRIRETIWKHFIFKFICNFEKPAVLNLKRLAKTQENIFRALVTIAATLNSDVNHLGNHTDAVAI